jgi:hypothetical protein
MKIYIEGEKSKGFCKKCKKIVQTTFKVSSRSTKVSGVLVGQCDVCDQIVSIPQQSSPRIKEVINSKKYSLEVRLPIHLLDILILASDQFEVEAPEQSKDSLLRYYIALAGDDKKIAEKIKGLSTSDFGKGSGYRLTLRLNGILYTRFERLMKQTKLNKTQLIKGLILQINEDILQKPEKKRITELEKLMAISA